MKKLYSNMTDNGVLNALKRASSPCQPHLCMDIGSWDGGDAIALANTFTKSIVIAVEGSPMRIETVIKNCRYETRIKVIQAAVSGEDKTDVTMYHSFLDGDPHCGTLKGFQNNKKFPKGWKEVAPVYVTTVSASSLITKLGMGIPDIIHMDVEGSEYDILSSLFSSGMFPRLISMEVVGGEWFEEAPSRTALSGIMMAYGYSILMDAHSDEAWIRQLQ